MICPSCGWDNVAGVEACVNCQQDLTPFDRPAPTCRFERSLMEDSASVLATHIPVLAPASLTVQEAVELMLERNVGALLIVNDDGRLLGILSERDLLKKVAGLRDDYARLPIVDFMTTRPEAVNCGDSLAVVLNKMDFGGYRHVPLVKNGQPVGIISVRDMLRHLTRMCEKG